MDLKQKTEQRINLIADETLNKIEQIGDTARKALRDAHIPSYDVFASMNSMTSTSTIQNLEQISLTKWESYQILAQEPAIARVVVTDDTDKKLTYYICRTMPISGVPHLASYRAPVGRLASLPIGSDFTLPNGTTVEVLERSRLRPTMIDQEWDSRDTIVESDDFGPITIESLRALLKKAVSVDRGEDLLGQLLAEESQAANVIEGVRRSVITKMELRDQPVLDQYQDEIFRLPLNKHLLILGPPGTGKTTTLIRRLGQKLDTNFLDTDEQQIVESVSAANGTSHTHSWLMFTPTELLKQYLKEAFAREGVPASDQRITTWADYRWELARNTFGVLRTAADRVGFVFKEKIEILTIDAHNKRIEWFSDFDKWQRSTFLEEVSLSAQKLSKNSIPKIAELGQRLLAVLQRAGSDNLASTFTSLNAEVAGIQSLVADMKAITDDKIQRALNLQLNRNNAFIDDMAKFISGLLQVQDSEIDEEDDQDSDEDDVSDIPRPGRAAAFSAYMRALRAQARAHASKRRLGKNTRNGRIIEWLGDRTLSEADFAEVGASLLVQGSARRFINPVRRYINGISKRYRAFRRLRQEEGKWYRKDGFNHTDLHPLELDVVLLAILRNAYDFLSKPNIVREIDAPVWSSLKPILELYKNQILVDEAADFSPIQIACMAALTHPLIRSFFACGDFNQRLTTWGCRTFDEMQWVFPELDVKEITVTYRQSRQLNELAREIILAAGGTDQKVTLPAHVDNEGVAPVLLEGISSREAIVDWLAQRIREIERFVRQLPSIAIFVESEKEVQPIADALSASLANENAQVVACVNGQVMGKENDVRVFDVQHIKGLEFEAVFFIGVDRLAALHPLLFDKYLYVGTTRAATYLGITCDDVLPAAISNLRPLFISDWSTP